MADRDGVRADAEQILEVGKRRVAVVVGVGLLLGLGALALISQAADIGKALRAFESANKLWLIGLAAGQIAAYAGYALGYRVVARACGGPCFRYPVTLQLTAVSFSAYVVGSTAGGLAVDFWAVHRAGEDVHRAGRRILAFNILEWAILGALAAAAGALMLAGVGERAPTGPALGWLVVVAGATAAALWISAPARRDRFAGLPRDDEPDEPGWWTRDRLRWLWAKLEKGFADAIGGLVLLRQLLAHPLRYAGAPAGFALYWLGDMLTLYAALRALGGELDPVALVLAYATGHVVASAPLPAGAAGFAEAATAYALHLVGVALGTAILAVLLFRAFTFWIPIPVGLAVLPRVRALNEELPDTPREDDPPCRLETRAAGRR